MLKLIHIFDMPYESVIDFSNGFRDYNETGPLYLMYARISLEEYYRWIKEYEKETYYLIDDNNPDYIIGQVSINFIGLDFHQNYLHEGNIGYSIRPNERNKGYGNDILKLILSKCEGLGMNEVCISCHKENIASKKVIEYNGGIFDREFIDFDNGKQSLKYWIKLHPKVKEYIKWKKYMMKFK